MLVMFGRVSMQVGFLDLASLIVDSLLPVKDISPVLAVELSYLNCELTVTSSSFEKKGEDGGKSMKLDSRRVEAMSLGRRIEALKIMERTLSTCKRLDKPNLLEEGAIIAWNISLPLLQPHLRKHVHRTLQVAARFIFKCFFYVFF